MVTNATHNISVPKSHDLYQLFDKWIEVTQQYAQELDHGDAAWLYGERASIGFVAAAIWKAGGVALEEYWSKKKRDDGDKRTGGFYVGRCDLYFKLQGNGFIAEAKKTSVTFDFEKSLPVIQQELDKACADAKALVGKERKLGIVCVAFRHPQRKAAVLLEAIADWSKQIKASETLKQIEFAWVFPHGTRELPHNDCISPGSAIFVKECI